VLDKRLRSHIYVGRHREVVEVEVAVMAFALSLASAAQSLGGVEHPLPIVTISHSTLKVEKAQQK
jgi:hypothetical protein